MQGSSQHSASGCWSKAGKFQPWTADMIAPSMQLLCKPIGLLMVWAWAEKLV
jgi:hypothetical protein